MPLSATQTINFRLYPLLHEGPRQPFDSRVKPDQAVGKWADPHVPVMAFNDSSTNRYMEDAFHKISSFQVLSFGWDSFGSQPPNVTAIANARAALVLLHRKNITVDKISASSDEGIMFEIMHPHRYMMYEFSNDGAIVRLKRNQQGRSDAAEIALADVADQV